VEEEKNSEKRGRKKKEKAQRMAEVEARGTPVALTMRLRRNL